jgi:hypothetical protein
LPWLIINYLEKKGKMQPLWIAPAVQKMFNDCILLPINKPLLFSPTWSPPRKVFGVFGRDGVGKCEMIEELAKRNQIETITFTVPEFGSSVDGICDNIMGRAVQLSTNAEPHIFIIKRAQLLCRRSVSESSQLVAVNIRKLVADTQHYVVMLFDEPPMPANAFERAFYAQLERTSFASAPDRQFRQELFSYILTSYAADLRFMGRPKVQVIGDDNTLEWLAMCSGFTTPRQIERWCKAVFYSLVTGDSDEKTLDQQYLQKFMSNTTGAEHIIANADLQREESRFSSLCGGGMIDEEEPPAKKVRVTTFTEENVSADVAAQAITEMQQ